MLSDKNWSDDEYIVYHSVYDLPEHHSYKGNEHLWHLLIH